MSRVPTGIKGLDEMLDGGFPKGRVILLCGGPGTGKTIFSLQFLASAARMGTHSVYVTLEEPVNLVRENMNEFNWNIQEKEKSNSLKLLELHVTSYEEDFSRRRDRRDEETVLSITNKVIEAAKSIGAELLVIDPLTSIAISETRAGNKRRKIAELFGHLRQSGYTSILTSETTSYDGEFYMEEFLADGVIRLDKVIHNFNLIRTIRIEKMRGVEHDEQPRRYVIDKNGFSIYNTEPIKV